MVFNGIDIIFLIWISDINNKLNISILYEYNTCIIISQIWSQSHTKSYNNKLFSNTHRYIINTRNKKVLYEFTVK